MSARGWVVIGTIACLAAMHGPLVGQQQAGGLRVILTDPSGSLVPGAEVEFRGSALIRPVFGVSSDQGLIVKNSLPPGTYTLIARCPGFQTAVKEEVVVRVGRSYSVEMALEVGRVESTIVVEAGGAAIDTFKSEAAAVFTGEGLTNAAGGRDFTDYARFAPSVNIEALSGNVIYRGQGAHGISVDGSSGAENVFYVDGVDTTSMYNGLNNQNLRVETVEEFQLKTAGYEAEFGGAMGGVLSARTRSGSDKLHGSLLWYGSGSALTGRPRKRLRLDPAQSIDVSEYVLDPEDGDLTQEFGFTLGGPIWRDRAWFFGGFLSEVRNRTRSVTFTSGDAGQFQRKDRLRSIPLKVDFQPAERVRLMASAVTDRFDWKGGLPHLDGTSNPDFEWAREGFEYPGYTLTGAAAITFSPFLAVDARWGLNAIQTEQLLGPAQVRHRFPESPGLIGYSPDDALYRPRGFSTIGHGASFNTAQDFQKKSTLSLSGSYVTRGAGQHNLRFGWQFNGLAHDINDAYKFDYIITNPGRGLSVDRFVEVGLPATPRPKRTYNAFEFRLRKAFRHNWLADVAYVNSRLHGLYSGLGSSDENGRLSPNVTRDFDLWFLNYDSRGNLIDGPLGTDRTHQLKVHWTYITPWEMEVGGFFRAMSGAPISRTVNLEHVDVLVDNRGSDGRNPAWTQTDLSLVQRFHPFSDETRSLEINLNVINQGTPLRTFRSLYRQSLPLWQPGDPVSRVLDGYDYRAIAASQGATRDPRFLQHDRFLDPISARFGIRFVF